MVYPIKQAICLKAIPTLKTFGLFWINFISRMSRKYFGRIKHLKLLMIIFVITCKYKEQFCQNLYFCPESIIIHHYLKCFIFLVFCEPEQICIIVSGTLCRLLDPSSSRVKTVFTVIIKQFWICCYHYQSYQKAITQNYCLLNNFLLNNI